MTNFDRQPGGIDDPSLPGGQDVEVDRLPPGDSAGDTGEGGEPEVTELDLPGPDDPVAWNYVEPDTEVVGPDGDRLGKVKQMVGTDEGIFQGVAVDLDGWNGTRLIAAERVTSLTPSRVTVDVDGATLAHAEEYEPPS